MTKLLTRAAIAAALAAGVSLPAFAQSVLVVDLDRVYAESAAGKNGTQQLQARYNPAAQQAQTAFNSARTSYDGQVEAARKALGPNQNDASKLPPATQQALATARDRVEDAQEQGQRVQQAIQASAAYVRDQINQALLPIAEQVRAERKAAIVIPRGGLLASDTAADITSVVLPRLDQRLPTVQVVPPQAAAPAAPATGTTPPAARPQPQGR